MGQHRERGIGLEIGCAAMHHRVRIGILGIDPERLRQTCAIGRLDRGEAELSRGVAGGDEADPARAEDADAVKEDYVVVGPVGHRSPVTRKRYRLSSVSSATSISTMAGPVLTSAP